MTPRGADVERALALRDVMDHAVRVQREISAARPLGPSRGRRVAGVLLSALLLGFSGYSLIAKPEFIWGRSAALPPGYETAGARVGMALLAQRIEAYRQGAGSYPTTLADVDAAASGVEYRLLSASVFELRMTVDGALLHYRSDQSRAAFLDGSLERIRGGVR